MNAIIPARLDSEMTFAKALSTSDLVPRAFRGKPANILLAINLGHSLGLDPAVALTSIHVIDGQPSLSAQLQAALVRRAGHKLRLERTDGAVTAVLIRKDDPDYEHRVTWDMARAKAAGLAGRGAWQQYPEAMLANRATTEVIRVGASDVLLGAAYDPEELTPAPPAPAPEPEVIDAVVVDDDDEGATDE